jgi:N-acetylglucosamine kinase-like BadF-type ATPase
MASEYFLGVDGGQSGTAALIGDAEGRMVGWGTAGPCDHVSSGEAREKFLRVMRECIGQAMANAGIQKGRFRSACFGLSGGPDDKAALVHEVVHADRMAVTDDAKIALAGATGGDPGVVVIGGTGSIAFGENARGEIARAGGWGYIFGDEGSGFDIARRAMRAVLREFENRGARTALTPALLEATGTSDANEMLHLFYTPEWPRSRVARLAQTVDRLAEESDPVAFAILECAAEDLAELAAAVRVQLFREEETALVSWTGGVFESRILRERFRALTSAIPPRYGPAQGALLLAWRAAGVHVTPREPAS